MFLKIEGVILPCFDFAGKEKYNSHQLLMELKMLSGLNLFKKKGKYDPSQNYCLDCGACCAYFKVYFNKGEVKSNGGSVPDEMTQTYNKRQGTVCMSGRKEFGVSIDKIGRRKISPCVALTGEIGKEVSCSVYENRPSVCRDFPVIMPNGEQNPRCKKARVAFGLVGELPNPIA